MSLNKTENTQKSTREEDDMSTDNKDSGSTLDETYIEDVRPQQLVQTPMRWGDYPSDSEDEDTVDPRVVYVADPRVVCVADPKVDCVADPKEGKSSCLSKEQINRIVEFLKPFRLEKKFTSPKNLGKDLYLMGVEFKDIPNFIDAALVSSKGITSELAVKYYGDGRTALEKAGLDRMVTARPRNGRPGQFVYSINRYMGNKKSPKI